MRKSAFLSRACHYTSLAGTIENYEFLWRDEDDITHTNSITVPNYSITLSGLVVSKSSSYSVIILPETSISDAKYPASLNYPNLGDSFWDISAVHAILSGSFLEYIFLSAGFSG